MIETNLKIRLVGKCLVSGTLALMVCLYACVLQAETAGSPQAAVRTFTDEVFQILKERPDNTLARRQMIETVVDKYFDFAAIARLAIGPRWRNLPPEGQQEFTTQFSKLLYYKYIGDIEKYAAQKITYHERTITPGYVVVEARAAGVQGGQVSIDYYLHINGGNWRVYDVGIQGLSLVTNYRNQFDSILANGSFDDLSIILRQRIAQLCGSNRC